MQCGSSDPTGGGGGRGGQIRQLRRREAWALMASAVMVADGAARAHGRGFRSPGSEIHLSLSLSLSFSLSLSG
jgi:hypothetical protein